MFRRQTILEVTLLAVLVTALTFAAAWVYPTWDDGRLMFAIGQWGSDAIWTNFGNRPLAALFYLFLFKHNLFFSVGIVLHWIGWVSMGLVTMRFWRLMFPEHAELALLPALLSVAPILCKVQLILLTVETICLIPPVLGFIAIFLLLSQPPSLSRRIAFNATGLALMVFSIFMSEYGVVTAIVAFVFVGAKAIFGNTARKRQLRVLSGLIAVCILSSYSVFLWLNRAAEHDAFRPSYIFAAYSLRIPFRLVSGIWRGVIGGVLEALGSVTLNTKPAVISFISGIVVSALVVFLISKRRPAEFAFKQDKFSVVTMFASVTLALIPVVLMDRTLESSWDSRFWMPMLPVLSSLSVYILCYVLRPRLFILVPVLCGLLAGFWTPFEIVTMIRNPPIVQRFQEENYQIGELTSTEFRCIKQQGELQ